MIICGGTICSSIISKHLTNSFGTKYVTSFSVFLTSLALFWFSISTSFWMLCISVIPYGLGTGTIDAALNNYVALNYNSRHMSWPHCFLGVGTIISPYIVSFALVNSTWNNGYRIISFIQFFIAFILLSTLAVWKVNEKKDKKLNSTSNRYFKRSCCCICIIIFYWHYFRKIYCRIYFWSRIYNYCIRLCTYLSKYYPFDSNEFWSWKFIRNYRYTNGKCLCRFNLYSTTFRYYFKLYKYKIITFFLIYIFCVNDWKNV